MFRGGGVQEHLLALQEEYTKRGHYVKILTPRPRDYKEAVPDNMLMLGGSVHTTAFGGTSWQLGASMDAGSIDDVLEREKYDLIHFHEPWLPFWGRQLLVRAHMPRVATMHARFYDNLTAKTISTIVTPYTKPMIKYFDAFTASAENSTEYFRTLSKKPIHVVPMGVDIKKYGMRGKRKPLNPGGKTIVYIGRLNDRKGVHYLLRAFNELRQRHPDVHLIVAGSGPDENKLRDLAETLNIQNLTFDARYIPEELKLNLLHNADLACFPATYGESFGIVLVEALAAEIPTVAGDNIGYSSVMTGRGNLSIVNSKDTGDFARRLGLMLFDDDIRKLWIKWAKNHVKQFDYPKIADQYFEVYDEAIEHYKHRRSLT